jgi:hypothetical protein
VEYQALVRVADVLTVRPRISDIIIKQGKNGELVIIELTTEYLNAAEQVVVLERSTTIQRGPHV